MPGFSGVVAKLPIDPGDRECNSVGAKGLLLQRPGDGWRLADLARRVYTTPFHLARGFRDEVGMPVHQYHLRVRLVRALDLLLDTRQTLAEVALACGFASHSHFTTVFHRLTGVAPARLRAAAGGGAVRDVCASLLGGEAGRRRPFAAASSCEDG